MCSMRQYDLNNIQQLATCELHLCTHLRVSYHKVLFFLFETLVTTSDDNETDLPAAKSGFNRESSAEVNSMDMEKTSSPNQLGVQAEIIATCLSQSTTLTLVDRLKLNTDRVVNTNSLNSRGSIRGTSCWLQLQSVEYWASTCDGWLHSQVFNSGHNGEMTSTWCERAVWLI